MQHTVSGGGIIVGPSNKIVVVSQHGNSWSLPKGHVDPGENLVEAAIRETEEEAGITSLKLIKKLGSYKRYQIARDGSENKNELKTIHIFLFSTAQTDLQPIDPDNPEARWVSADEVEALLTHPKDKAFYASILPTLNTFLQTRSSTT